LIQDGHQIPERQGFQAEYYTCEDGSIKFLEKVKIFALSEEQFESESLKKYLTI
jgi:hypothetical protein